MKSSLLISVAMRLLLVIQSVILTISTVRYAYHININISLHYQYSSM